MSSWRNPFVKMGSRVSTLKPKVLLRPSDPLILDRWLDVAYIMLWISYGVWGVVTAWFGIPTFTQLTSETYQTIWSGALGLLALAAAVMALLVFFDTPWMLQISKKRAEHALVICIIPFITVYPILLVIRVAEGDHERVAGTLVLRISYLIFPILRVYILRGRIKKLKDALVVVPNGAP